MKLRFVNPFSEIDASIKADYAKIWIEVHKYTYNHRQSEQA